MAITQISQLQVRRGLDQDLPQLASGELGWSIDARQLYIGNGTLAEGAPELGVTEVLTQYSILNFTNSLTSNIGNLAANVTTLQGNVVALSNQLISLQAASGTNSNTAVLAMNTSGTFAGLTGNNGIISYSVQQGTAQRTGQLKYSFSNSLVSYEEEYTQDSSTFLAITMTANSSYASVNYNTTGASTITSLTYQVKSI